MNLKNYSLIKINDKYKIDLINYLKGLFNDEIIVDNYYGYISIESVYNDNYLMLIKTLLYETSFESIQILVVPFIDKTFIKYFDFYKNDLKTIYEIFVLNLNNPIIIDDLKYIASIIDNDSLDTLKAYIECNKNICKTAETLYLHRNSLNYRLNNFNLKTNMNYQDLNTLMLIKLITTIK